ncbi:MAG: hypothetical protein WBE76_05700 [Terracidiphilus sp.]
MADDSNAGEKIVIAVPRPAPESFNRDRPISDLIKTQLQHIHHAESARLLKAKREGRRPEDIHTEAEAASYITAVTKLLHPQKRKRSKPRKSS